MPNTLRRGGAILLLGGLLVTSACSGGAPDGGLSTPSPTNAAVASTPPSDPPPPPTTSTAPSPTSSRTPAGPKAVAKRDARRVLQRYFQVHDACMSHPKKSKMTCFNDVTIGTEQRNNRNALSSARAYGARQVGRTKVVTVEPVKVDLTNKPQQQPPVIPTVVFEVCYDVSKVNIVDGDGRSLVTADRINHGRAKISVYNYKYPDQAQWRVGYSADPVKDPTC